MNPREDFKDDFQVATDEDARHWEEESRRLYEGTQYAIMGVLGGGGLGDAALVPGPTVKHPKGIRMLSDWLMAMAAYPDYIEEVFAMQTEVMLKNLEIYRQAVGEHIQVLWVSGTDFGTQNGPFTSVDMFRRLYKPYYVKINRWIHENTGWKSFYHTCGCVNALLDDLADMGVDCLNPVQFSAMEPKGMGPQRLKDEYGDRFTFWGGGVDTQHVLPFGSPDEVRRQVAERVKILNKGGGFIFNPIHNVVAKVPTDNLIAMYETVIGEKLR
jgi:uroporphyrinogen-III decarboxylase